MPYVPPHLRHGYIPTQTVKDYTGKVHWPTNIDSFKDTNVVESSKVHSPHIGHSHHLGIVAAKSSLKLTKPISINTEPLAKPSMRLGRSKFNSAVRRHISKKFIRKRVSRRRSMSHRKKRLTRKRKTY